MDTNSQGNLVVVGRRMVRSCMVVGGLVMMAAVGYMLGYMADCSP